MTVVSEGLLLNSKYIKMGREEGGFQALLTQLPLVIVCHELIIWLPACRRLLFNLLHAEKVPFPRATKEIGDVCTQANHLAANHLRFCDGLKCRCTVCHVKPSR